jgi:hypothetical protein
MSSSEKAVYAAIGANRAVAAVKFVAAAFTGSSSMLAEGIHSSVDAGKNGLLLVGSRSTPRARRDSPVRLLQGAVFLDDDRRHADLRLAAECPPEGAHTGGLLRRREGARYRLPHPPQAQPSGSTINDDLKRRAGGAGSGGARGAAAPAIERARSERGSRSSQPDRSR